VTPEGCGWGSELSTYVSGYLSIYLYVRLSICLSICLCTYLLSIYLTVCLSDYPTTWLPIYLSICLSICLSVCLSIVYLSDFQSFRHYLTLRLSDSLFVFVLSVYPLHLSDLFVSPPHVEHFSLRNVPHGTTAYLFSIPPRPLVFTTLDLRDCFAPQQNALFRHGRSKSGPRPSVFNTFDESASRQMHLLLRHLNVQKWPENM